MKRRRFNSKDLVRAKRLYETHGSTQKVANLMRFNRKTVERAFRIDGFKVRGYCADMDGKKNQNYKGESAKRSATYRRAQKRREKRKKIRENLEKIRKDYQSKIYTIKEITMLYEVDEELLKDYLLTY